MSLLSLSFYNGDPRGTVYLLRYLLDSYSGSAFHLLPYCKEKAAQN